MLPLQCPAAKLNPDLDARLEGLEVEFPLDRTIGHALVKFERRVQKVLCSEIEAQFLAHIIVGVKIEGRPRFLVDICRRASADSKQDVADIFAGKSKLDGAFLVSESKIAGPWGGAGQKALGFTVAERDAGLHVGHVGVDAEAVKWSRKGAEVIHEACLEPAGKGARDVFETLVEERRIGAARRIGSTEGPRDDIVFKL